MMASPLQPGQVFLLANPEPYLAGVQYTCMEAPADSRWIVAKNDHTQPIYIDKHQQVELISDAVLGHSNPPRSAISLKNAPVHDAAAREQVERAARDPNLKRRFPKP